MLPPKGNVGRGRENENNPSTILHLAIGVYSRIIKQCHLYHIAHFYYTSDEDSMPHSPNTGIRTNTPHINSHGGSVITRLLLAPFDSIVLTLFLLFFVGLPSSRDIPHID